MASHLRTINQSAWQRGLQGDAASEASGPDISFIIASAGLLVAFFAIILYCRHCLRPFIEEAAEQERQQREAQPDAPKMSTEQRKAYISKLLVTKQVLASGSANGASTEKYENMVLPRLTSSIHNDAEEEDEEKQDLCPICLEEYKDGDEICWSHSELCAHVFHRECVFEWLVRHDECPTCRQAFISLDGINEHGPQNGENEADGYELELARTNDMSSDEGSVTEDAAPQAVEVSPRVSILSIMLRKLRITRTRTDWANDDARPLEGVSDSIHGIRPVASMDETDENSSSSGMEDIELGSQEGSQPTSRADASS
jgi:hypothetical protein